MAQWTTAETAAVAELVRHRAGLVFPEARVRDVESTMRRVVSRRGVTGLTALLHELRRDDRVLESLVAELTIGETYFHRDRAQLDVLRRRILPALLVGRPADRPVRVWSAGCASGEEPYSVAMIFDELNLLHRADIVGTDISRPRLAEAQRAVYSRWSLRDTPDDVRRQYFRERGGFFELLPRIREHVDFRYLNLAEDNFPSLASGIWGMDVVLCRNVLIYFGRDTVERVARRLIASLSEDGWLVLGASDPPIGDLVECDVVLTEAGLVYRRPGAAGDADLRRSARRRARSVTRPDEGALPPAELPKGADAVPLEAAPPQPEVTPQAKAPPSAVTEPRADESAVLAAYAARDFTRVRALAEQATSAGGATLALWAAWLRALANQGCVEEALAVADRAQKEIGLHAELLYLEAVLRLQSGHAADAATAARRALYVDRSLVVAHLALAEAYRREGDVEAARRSLRNAAQLLALLAPDSGVPASDGETAGRLAELVRVKLQLLNGQI